MAASRMNYIVTFEGFSQVYGCASLEGALETPPPEGCSIEGKRAFFITHEPDLGAISVHEVPREDVLSAELKYPTKRKKKDEQDS